MDLHLLKTEFQKHFTDGLVTIVGSGLSCAEGLPSMGDLATHLDNTIASDVQENDLQVWKTISSLLPEIGLEAALLQVPPTVMLEAAILSRTAELVALGEKKVITEVFSRRKVLNFTRLVKHLLKPSNGLPIVTTNYDRLIEVAVEEAGLGVNTLFVGSFAGRLNPKESGLRFLIEVDVVGNKMRRRYRSHAKVFKPHGSLDWYHRDGSPVQYSGELDLPPLIITPGRNKFRNGYESPFDLHRAGANSAIDKASRFLVIGYGFNDDHLETHLTPRIRSGVPTLMLARTLSAKALKLAAECAKVIAVERAESNGMEGSKVFLSQGNFFFPGSAWWNLGKFIDEVLEC